MNGLNGKVYGLILLLSLVAISARAPMANAQNSTYPNNFTRNAGENISTALKSCITCTSGSCYEGAYSQASAEGNAANWADPDYLDFGDIAVGDCSVIDYMIEVPAGTPSGTYTLRWYYTCQGDKGGSCSPYTKTITITVNGAETTTTETTTINGESIYPCPPGEEAGGVPGGPTSSMFCYPADMRMAESGSASVVDLTGSPTDSFIVGDLAWTEADSSLSVSAPISAPGYSLSLGPDTLGAMIQVMGNPISGFSSAEDSSYYDAFDSQALNFGVHLSSAAITDIALHHFLALGGAGALTTTMITTPITMIEIGYGEIRLTESTLQNIGWAAKCLVSPSMLACPEGTNFTMSVAGNGTTITAFNGSILVASLSATNSTLKYVTLYAGQQLFIPDDPAKASQQNLMSSTRTLTQSTTSSIPPSPSTTSLINGMSDLQLEATLFVIILIVIALLRMRRKPKTSADQPIKKVNKARRI